MKAQFTNQARYSWGTGRQAKQAAQVFKAFENINQRFYSWKSIFRRWLRLARGQSFRGNLLGRLFHLFLISGIFFKLSVFQRDHAQKRVYPMKAGERELDGAPLPEGISV
jgi:hypothetical protein